MPRWTRPARRFVERTGFTVERLPHRAGLEFHVLRVATVHNVDGVIDVGANEGQFGTALRRAGYRGRILSFEPQPRVFDVLATRAARDGAWEARSLALGDARTTLDLHLAADTTVSSMLTPRRDWVERWPSARVIDRLPVQVKRLDDLADEIPFKRIYLKVDTQGYDLRVLAGAQHLLERVVALQLELSVTPLYDGMPDYIEALTCLREMGFVLSGMFPAVLADERMRAVELDGVFVRDR